jgi:nucleoside-diphosphate-sugar epimerase
MQLLIVFKQNKQILGMNYKTLVFGCSGTVGMEFIKENKHKDILYFSRKKPKNIAKKLWRYVDLDKKIEEIPKKTDKIFFFSSPYYKYDNLIKDNFLKELSWLKKIRKITKTKTFIYLSSGSVYLKNHPVGKAKLKCEKYLINKSNYGHVQIWRPYNLIGIESLNLSDHFHNVLIKEFCINKKKIHQFKGSEKDVRGYSSARKFCKSLIAKSNLNKSFIYEYGNSNTITVKQVATIFKKIFEKIFDKKIKYNFNSSVMNINIIKSNKLVRSLDSKENSYKIIMKYYLSKVKLYEK